MKQQIIIDRREHSFSILDRVDEMRRDKQYCDFLIKVDFEEIPVHRIILAGASEYFDKMFSSDMKEKKSGVVEMKDLDAECTVACVDHIYGAEVYVPDGKFEEMMHVADLMQLHTLREAIEDLLQSNLNAESFFVAKRIANLYRCKRLAKECKAFALNNFVEISKQEEFGELEKDYIKRMMKEREMKMSEAEKLDAVLRWVKFSTERSKLMMDMVKLVVLSDVPPDFRRHLIEREPLVTSDCDCLLHFSISMMDSMGIRPKSLGRLQWSEGGIVVFDDGSCHLQKFDPTGNSWMKMQEVDHSMMASSSFTLICLENHLYVLLENKSVYRLEFSDETATWERMADTILCHGPFPPAVVLLGNIYIIGHGGMHWPTRVVSRYNPDSDEWTRLPDKPQPIGGSALVAFDKSIYSFGGDDGNGWTDNVEVFSPSSTSWEVVGSMNEVKCQASAVEMNGSIYVLGGNNGWKAVSTTESFDVETCQCTTLCSMKRPRRRHRGFVIDGSIYAVGGINTFGSIEKYDVSMDEWQLVELPENMKLRIKESAQL